MSEELKKRVGEAAAAVVENGMRLGIGTGSTAEAFIEALALRVADGLKIKAVPTSVRTQKFCEDHGISMQSLDEYPELDLTIDGADEIDPDLNLIKGAGGALLREKIVAAASADMLVIADGSKKVERLGEVFPVPVEINEFGLKATQRAIEKMAAKRGLNASLALRKKADGQAFVTDGGHLIIDASFGRIAAPEALADELNAIPGVVEHGLFTGLASRAMLASNNGIEILERQGS